MIKKNSLACNAKLYEQAEVSKFKKQRGPVKLFEEPRK